MTIYTGSQYLEMKLPRLSISNEKRRIKQASRSGYGRYPGEILIWPNFEQHVRQYCRDNPPEAITLTSDGLDALVNQEVILCAQEKSVEGRFNQHVMHVVEHCATASGLSVQLTDFRAAKEAQSQGPQADFAGVSRGTQHHLNQELRFIGECKADFENQLPDDFENALSNLNDLDKRIRFWLEQPITYLIHYKLKFAFLTTYTFTIFICLPTHVNSAEPTVFDRVYISHPISYDSPSSVDSVTVRQAVWFMLHRSRYDYGSKPRTPIDYSSLSHLDATNIYKDKSTGYRLPPGAAPPPPSGPQIFASATYNDLSQMKSAPVFWSRMRLKNGKKQNVLAVDWKGKDVYLGPHQIRRIEHHQSRHYVGEVVTTTKTGEHKTLVRLTPRDNLSKNDMDKYLQVKRLEIRTR